MDGRTSNVYCFNVAAMTVEKAKFSLFVTCVKLCDT